MLHTIVALAQLAPPVSFLFSVPFLVCLAGVLALEAAALVRALVTAGRTLRAVLARLSKILTVAVVMALAALFAASRFADHSGGLRAILRRCLTMPVTMPLVA